MLRRQTKKRTWARVGGVLLSAATLTGAASTTSTAAEANGVLDAARSSATLAPTTNGANPFAARIVVLEFASKTDADADRTNALLNAMRGKNYPIQRVERENGGAELLRIRVYSEKDYQDKFDTERYQKIGRRGNFLYYVNVVEGEELSITQGQVKELFEII